ncbi:MAG: sigma-70 family RNA polymerase sigma factor [Vicinamibacterales bacterium]
MTPALEHELTLLMAASQRGDGVAYDALLRSLQVVVRLYVRKRVGGTLWVEDVVQEVLLSLHRARHTWNPDRPFAPWFYAILQSRFVDTIRVQRRIGAREEPMDATPPAVCFDSVEAATIARADLAEALRQLSPQQRFVIERLKLAEWSVKQVATETGLTESNVKVIAHRGYAALKRLLIGAGYDE